MNQQRGMNMSKKYFTKYLPVEGEIKEGAIVKWANYEFVQVSQAQINNSYNIKQFTADGKCYKLFLCSRDIQVGDKYYNQRLNLWGDAHVLPSDPADKCIKVIGEISPDALSYVKEGDEFDEEGARTVLGIVKR